MEIIGMDTVKVEPEVVQEIKQMLQDMNEQSAKIRIACEMEMGPMSFRLYIDEKHEDDIVEEHDGLDFIIADNLIKAYDGFSILSMKKGGDTFLQIKPNRLIEDVACSAASCSGCSSSAGCAEKK